MMHLKTVAIFVGICLYCTSAFAVTFQHPGGIHTAAQIAQTQQKLQSGNSPYTGAWSELISVANAGLSETPSAMADFNVPGYYRDDPQLHNERKHLLANDAAAAYSCALAYAVNHNLTATKRNQYADKAVSILMNWATVNKKISGWDGPLVTCYNGNPFMHAAELLWDYDGWTSSEKEQFKTWAKNAVYPVTSIKTRNAWQNWNCWALLMALSIDNLLEDEDMLDLDMNILKVNIDKQIIPSGEMPGETGRKGSGISYTGFALEPLAAAMEVARNITGEDYFLWVAPGGGTMKKALEYFHHYNRNPGDWPHYDGSLSTNGPTDERGGDVMEAAGMIYGESTWSSWAKVETKFMRATNATGLGWMLPGLMRPAPAVLRAPDSPIDQPSGSKLTVSSVVADKVSQNAGNTIDNSFSTRWAVESPPAKLTLDLGKQEEIGHIGIAWYQGDTRAFYFDVELSTDGSKWVPVLQWEMSTGTLTGDQFEYYDFADASARYVRLTGRGNSQSGYTSINEIAVFSAGPVIPTPPEIRDARPLSSTEIYVQFDQSVTPGTAEMVSNYALSPSVGITSATLSSDSTEVTLVVGSPLTVGTEYTLSVQGIVGVQISDPGSDSHAFTYTDILKLSVQSATASSDDGHGPENTIDGNLSESSRWSTQGNGEWIQYDLGAVYEVTSLKIAFYLGDQRSTRFDVQVSLDGSSWTTAATDMQSSGSTTGLEEFDITDSQARYVRLMCYGNTASDWNSIIETEVYGKAGNGATAGLGIRKGALARVNLRTAHSRIHVDLPREIVGATVRIVNPAGMSILQVKNVDRAISTGALPKGIYFVNIVTGFQRTVHPVAVY